MVESAWKDTTDATRFRMFRLVAGPHGKLWAPDPPLAYDGASEFPIVELTGAKTFERWGEGYYKAQLFSDGDPARPPGRGFSCNVHVDAHGVAARELKREPVPAPAKPHTLLESSIAAQASAPLPAFAPPAGDDDDRFRAMLRNMNGEDALILMSFAEDRVQARQNQHDALRLSKTIEAFNFAGEVQRKSIDRLLDDARALDERKLSLELAHQTKTIELKSRKLEIEAARDVEDANAEQQDRIDELEERLRELTSAPNAAAAAAAGNNLLPLLAAAAPILLQLPAVQTFLKGIHPQAGALVDALAPAAVASFTAQATNGATSAAA